MNGGVTMKTIGIIGGSQKRTFEKIGYKNGCRILFHSGKDDSGRRKSFKHICKNADCVIVLLGACGHVSMSLVKELCKKYGTEVLFVNGFGATGAVKKALDHIEQAA